MPRASDSPDPLGKRALFWAPATREEEPPRRNGDVPVAGKRALFSAVGAEGPQPGASRPPVPASGPGGILPPVTLHCSSCGTRSEVDVVRYLGLHVPFFLWRPGRGFTRFMNCPACHRRTWQSASWTPWSAD
ncbi:MAG TPA: hypothetical protein VE991_12880 [Acidimicrobiales bacterium]|nr:hypothetical protein [Acidimicrobiales bacterium]